jgi:hypothetical protein
MNCCSSGTTAAVFTIGATLRSGWNACMKLVPLRHSHHRLPQFAAILPIGSADDEQASIAACEKVGLAGFLRRRM